MSGYNLLFSCFSSEGLSGFSYISIFSASAPAANGDSLSTSVPAAQQHFPASVPAAIEDFMLTSVSAVQQCFPASAPAANRYFMLTSFPAAEQHLCLCPSG